MHRRYTAGSGRRWIRVVGAAAAVWALAAKAGGTGVPLAAQVVPRTLTLEEAVRVAKDHNPAFRSVGNDRAAADWQVREAYARFLPSSDANLNFNYTGGGSQRFGTVDLGLSGTNWLQSSYNLNANWRLDGNAIFGVPAARANQDATDARVRAAEFDLESTVAEAYMTALRGRDGLEVAERQLERAEQNYRIVATRVAAGSAAGTEGKQAEVDRGRAEVDVVRARRDYREALALLAEQLGAPLPEEVELASAFEVFEPVWERGELLDMALSAHPSLRSFAAQEKAANASARQQASQYFPALSISTGIRGNTLEATSREFIASQIQDQARGRQQSCEFNNALIQGVPTLSGEIQDCGQFAATERSIQAALAQNDQFPFGFNKLPLSATFSVSIPVFTGFNRQRRVSEAHNAAEDARYDRRAEELRLRTAVTRAHENVNASYEVLRIEERNRALAGEQLDMQRRRYTLGAGSLLEFLDAQATLSEAEQAYLNALYDFHWNAIRLEAAVGRRLRSERP